MAIRSILKETHILELVGFIATDFYRGSDVLDIFLFLNETVDRLM